MTTTAQALAGTTHPLLTVKDVLERIQVGQTTLYRWMGAGKFPKPIPIGDAAVRWREEDLAAWIASKAAAGPRAQRPPRPGRPRSDQSKALRLRDN